MNNTEPTVYRWVRRELKKKTQRKFTSDNRKSVRGSLIIVKKKEEINDD